MLHFLFFFLLSSGWSIRDGGTPCPARCSHVWCRSQDGIPELLDFVIDDHFAQVGGLLLEADVVDHRAREAVAQAVVHRPRPVQ
uniref:Putative secreted protein n=1 Tax=Ixodes ricinus TaxID=34613 RepID=A0A6B0UEG1_IXORI